MNEARRASGTVSSIVLLLLSASCGGGTDPTGPDAPDNGLLATPLPPLETLEASSQQQLREQHAALVQTLADPQADAYERAVAFGEMGQRFHAYSLLTAAEPCYRNAELLAPGDYRWPHYRGDLALKSGDNAQARESFLRVLELDPDYLPAWIYLGRIQLEDDEIEQARRSFGRALELDAESAAALVGLGRIASLERDYAEALERFQTALRLASGADTLHYHLAMAYRGLGDLQAAERHMKLRGEIGVGVADPLLSELNALVTGAKSYQEQGMVLGKSGRLDEAVEVLRKAVELDPSDPTGHLYLGMALTVKGEPRAGLESFLEVLQFDPAHQQAHLQAGSILAALGDDRRAVPHFEAALVSHADLVPARLRLGQALQRLNRQEDALVHYERVIELDPANAGARLGRVFALVRLDRYAEARARLESDLEALPDQPAFQHALARLLAAAPDAAVRDGEQSMQIAMQLSQTMRNTDLAETIAMAHAELGGFADAVQWQRMAMETARRVGQARIESRMASKLSLYESRKPCREPWPDDDPVFTPAPLGAEIMLQGGGDSVR